MNDRPLITFALFAYNQEQFIEEAVRGAFSQTYSPLEIILSDDCSTDRTFGIMSRLANEYQGPHKVILNRNNPNLGLCGHVNKVVFGLAAADIVVFAAGDDVSLPDRVSRTWTAFQENPDVLSVSMEYTPIDTRGFAGPNPRRRFREGRWSLLDYVQSRRIPICGPTRAYRMTVFKTFGPLSPHCYAEDSPLVLRSLLIGTIWHCAMTGTFYRLQSTSVGARMNFASDKSIYRQNKRDLRCAIDRGLVSVRDAENIRAGMRRRIAVGLLKARFDRSPVKLLFFCVAVLPSRRLHVSEKRVYLFLSLRQLLPRWVAVCLRRLARSAT